MNDGILLRPMTAADADGVYRTSAESIPATDEERQQTINRSAEEVKRRKARYRHFLGSRAPRTGRCPVVLGAGLSLTPAGPI